MQMAPHGQITTMNAQQAKILQESQQKDTGSGQQRQVFSLKSKPANYSLHTIPTMV